MAACSASRWRWSPAVRSGPGWVGWGCQGRHRSSRQPAANVRRRTRRRRGRCRARPEPAGAGVSARLLPLVAAGMSGVGMLLYSGYMYQLTGNPLEWAAAQWAWGRGQQDIPAAAAPAPLADRRVRVAGLPREVAGPGQQRDGDDLRAGDRLAGRPALRLPVCRVRVARRAAAAPLRRTRIDGPITRRCCFRCSSSLALTIPARHRVAWASGFGVIQGLFAAVFLTGRTIY